MNYYTTASMELQLINGTRELVIRVDHPVERKRTVREVADYVSKLSLIEINGEYIKQSAVLTMKNIKIF